jgi:hypothetical protein
LFICLLSYSYANVSLTVNFDARLAGSALATEARTRVKTSHARMPLTPYTVGMGAVRTAIPTPKHNAFVMGKDNRMLIAQLISPTIIPSTMTML